VGYAAMIAADLTFALVPTVYGELARLPRQSCMHGALLPFPMPCPVFPLPCPAHGQYSAPFYDAEGGMRQPREAVPRACAQLASGCESAAGTHSLVWRCTCLEMHACLCNWPE